MDILMFVRKTFSWTYIVREISCGGKEQMFIDVKKKYKKKGKLFQFVIVCKLYMTYLFL